MTVKVTARDIERGKPALADSCPVALALQRQTGKTWSVYMRYALSHPSEKKYDLPQSVRDWIIAFDDGREVAPFTFKLEG